ncbi:MAG: bacterial Ig-like domain-containing protein, partial [Treponema sp.]|nr:bacterial Ig-like domain-containing protein [Treponema sp.]
IAVTTSNIFYFDNTKAGDQRLVVTVDGKSTFFTVHVRVLVSIMVQRMPYKGVYEPGEDLDLNGMVVVGTYSDTSTRIIPWEKLTITGFNSKTAGQQTVIVTAESRQASFRVTVLPTIRQ